MSEISEWSSVDEKNNKVPPGGFPEHQAPSTVNDSARALMGAVRRSYLNLPYFNPGGSITYINSSTFKVSDNQEITNFSRFYSSGRRLMFISSSGVKYGNVGSVSYSGTETEVKCYLDGGEEIDPQLTSVFCGLAPEDTGEIVGRLPVGCILQYTALTLPPGFIFADGKSFDPTIYTDLAKKWRTGENTYLYGQEIVGGAYWPKAPDVRGYFPRYLDMEAGIDTDRNIGDIQEDAIRNITGDVGGLDTQHGGQTSSGALYVKSIQSGSYSGLTSGYLVGRLGFDASRDENVNVADENRPKNIAFPALIVAWHGVSNEENIQMQDVLDAFNQMQGTINQIYDAKDEALEELSNQAQVISDNTLISISTASDSAVETVNDTKAAAILQVNETTNEAVNTINETEENAINAVSEKAQELIDTGDSQVDRVKNQGDIEVERAEISALQAAMSAGTSGIPMLSPLPPQLRKLSGNDAVGLMLAGARLDNITHKHLFDKILMPSYTSPDAVDEVNKYYGRQFGTEIDLGISIIGNLATDFRARLKIDTELYTQNLLAGNAFEMTCKVRTGSSVAGTQRMWGNNNGSTPFAAPFVYGLNGGKWVLYVTSNGTSWNIANAVLGTYTVLPDTDYWLRGGYDTGTGSFYVEYSLDGNTWVRDINVVSAATPFITPSGRYILGNHYYNAASTDRPWLGTLYIDSFVATVDGAEIWKSWYEIPSKRGPDGLRFVDVVHKALADDLFTKVGVNPYLVIDTAGGFCWLWNTKYPFSFTQDIANLNMYLQDQVQNATGVIKNCTRAGTDDQAEGAFQTLTAGKASNAGGAGDNRDSSFDLSRMINVGNETRGRGMTAFLYFKVGNQIINPEVIDANGALIHIDALEANKADKNLDTLTEEQARKLIGNRVYVSSEFSGMPGTLYVDVHDLNLDPKKATMELSAICLSDDVGFKTGDIVKNCIVGSGANNSFRQQAHVLSANRAYIRFPNVWTWLPCNFSTGAYTPTPNYANWAFFITIYY